MRDFDGEAGTKRCFQTRGYRSKYPNFGAINRGVKALRGGLEIRGDEQREFSLSILRPPAKCFPVWLSGWLAKLTASLDPQGAEGCFKEVFQ